MGMADNPLAVDYEITAELGGIRIGALNSLTAQYMLYIEQDRSRAVRAPI
jgi:hypothetical protein